MWAWWADSVPLTVIVISPHFAVFMLTIIQHNFQVFTQVIFGILLSIINQYILSQKSIYIMMWKLIVQGLHKFAYYLTITNRQHIQDHSIHNSDLETPPTSLAIRQLLWFSLTLYTTILICLLHRPYEFVLLHHIILFTQVLVWTEWYNIHKLVRSVKQTNSDGISFSLFRLTSKSLSSKWCLIPPSQW
jgi:hypothetical protein